MPRFQLRDKNGASVKRPCFKNEETRYFDIKEPLRLRRNRRHYRVEHKHAE
jgi:hypothetical protein